jgi:hypothetical protein
MKVTVRIENWYSDGHESKSDVVLDYGGEPLDDFWQDVVFPHTGDGHGIDGLGSCYTATIIAADDPQLLGENTEWID